jgi:DNA-binding response OmpR family regulator
MKMPHTIVWIDDDIDIISPVVELLRRAGYHLLQLRTAAEALEAVEQIRRADLTLLDMILPPGQSGREFSRFSGQDVLQELREAHGVTTPVIVLTVVQNPELYQQLMKLGVVDIIVKPVLPSELKARVEKALGIETKT